MSAAGIKDWRKLFRNSAHFGFISQTCANGHHPRDARIQGALNNSLADIAVSITGIAGPGGSEFKPEGRVCFGITSRVGSVSETVEFGAIGRKNVRESARDHALSLLIKAASQF